MLSARQYIVCFGRDRLLLAARQRVLETSGYRSLSTSDPITASRWIATENVSILVLCHTLKEKEVDAINRVHRGLHSTATILHLHPDQWNFSIGHAGLLCDARTTPAAFLSAVSELSGRLRQTA